MPSLNTFTLGAVELRLPEGAVFRQVEGRWQLLVQPMPGCELKIELTPGAPCSSQAAACLPPALLVPVWHSSLLCQQETSEMADALSTPCCHLQRLWQCTCIRWQVKGGRPTNFCHILSQSCPGTLCTLTRNSGSLMTYRHTNQLRKCDTPHTHWLPSQDLVSASRSPAVNDMLLHMCVPSAVSLM